MDEMKLPSLPGGPNPFGLSENRELMEVMASCLVFGVQFSVVKCPCGECEMQGLMLLPNPNWNEAMTEVFMQWFEPYQEQVGAEFQRIHGESSERLKEHCQRAQKCQWN